MNSRRTNRRATAFQEVRKDSNRLINIPYLLYPCLSVALLVMLISGVHIGWGICYPQLRLQEWHLDTYPSVYTMVILSWYLGAILGSLLTLYVYTKFTKREIYVSDFYHSSPQPSNNIITASEFPVLYWSTVCGKQWPLHRPVQ